MILNLRPFQIILLGVFLALALGGLMLFAIFRGFGSEPNPYGTSVEIWGTLDSAGFRSALTTLTDADENFRVVSYVRKNPETFRDELVNAIAERRGPDAIVLSDDLLISERAKILPIPYTTMSERMVRDTYVDGAEIFSLSDGTYGFPFGVDPLVMYWNRDLFGSNGLAAPPSTWEVLTAVTVPSLVRIVTSPSYTIEQAALAFGEYSNVSHARSILLTLLMQAGSALITEAEYSYDVRLNQSSAQGTRAPAEAALDFYTQFANPARPMYTWNRSLPTDRNAFLAEDLALYFAPGSEYASLQAGNPNLNFDAAQVPQGSGVTIKKSHGRFYSLAMLRSSDNVQGTYAALAQLSAAQSAQTIVEGVGIAPVHREILVRGNADPFRQTMYSMALIARGFLDPNPAASGDIIKTMVEDITSGRARANQAVGDAEGRFNQLLR